MIDNLKQQTSLGFESGIFLQSGQNWTLVKFPECVFIRHRKTANGLEDSSNGHGSGRVISHGQIKKF